jgi:Uncharacterized protein conserved in bacteria (DUF2130)
MEAATPLRPPHVRVLPGERVAVDGLVVDDPTAARLVGEREQRGEDPARLVADAIEIGARVLDREQTGANAEAVKAEMDRATRELHQRFEESARAASDTLGERLDAVFASGGRLEKELERLFSDGSSESVQQSVKHLLAQSREDLQRQFSAEDERNPLGDFKRGTMALLRDAFERQDANQRALLERQATLEQQVQSLHAERQKQEEVAAERERGTAKGREYEELVFEALDDLATAQGDDCDAVGDVKGATRKTGDVVVAVDGCRGPARGRIVFEAKNSRLSKPEAMRELDRGRKERDAQYAVLVVPAEDKLPARTQQLREYNGDKLLVVYDPEEGSTLALELAYRLARARVAMARGDAGGLDAAAIGETVERALGAMDEVSSVKQKLTGASASIDSARELLDGMAETVRGHLDHIDGLLAPGDEPA